MEKSRFYDNMTKEMQEIYDETTDEEWLKKEYTFCNMMYEKALKAKSIKLPYIAESGNPVVHGAKMVIGDISNFWLVRKDALKQFLPREWLIEQGDDPFSIHV